MTADRQQALVDVRVLVLRDRQVLLQRLSSMFDGCWNLPGGHVMPGENAVAAAVRELQEEVALHVRAEDLTFRSVTHHRPPTRSEKVTFTFSTEVFTGEPIPAEPDRADVVRWTAWDDLPENLMPQAAASLELFRTGQSFATFNLGEATD